MMRPDEQRQQKQEPQNQEQDEMCERLRPELKAYVDGQAGWWQRQSIGRHLTRCAECREETAAMREFSAKWRRADDEVLAPNLRARILAAVPDAPPARTTITPAARPRYRSLALAGAGTSAVIGAALLFPIWQRGARTGPDDAAKVSLRSTGPVASVSSPAAPSGAAQTMDGATANVAAPPAIERNAAASAALPPKAKQTQIADARTFAFNKNDGATAGAETSGAGGSSSGGRDAAGESAVSPAPPSAAMSAKSAAMPTVAAPSISGSASAPSAPGSAAAATARDASPADNKADKPVVNDKSDKSKPDTYAAKSKPPTDTQGREKNAAPQEAHAASQTASAAMAHSAGHAQSSGGKALPAAPRLFAPHAASLRSSASYGYSRAMTPDTTSAVLLKIFVAHIETATASIERDIRAAGGNVISSATQTDADGVKSATLLLKAPAATLNAFLAQAEETGTTLLKSVPPTPYDASSADAAKRRANAPAPKEGRGQKAYTSVTIRLLNRREAP